MIRILAAVLTFQSVALATPRNFDIVDHPRYQYTGNQNDLPKVRTPLRLKTESSKRIRKFQVLTLDTRDQRICNHYSETLRKSGSLSTSDSASLCRVDFNNPYVSVAIDTDRRGYKYSELPKRDQDLVRQTRNFSVPAVGMMALLFALPQSFTGWESFNAEGLGQKWKDNVKAGPVKDTDEWAVNYIGHPYAGAAYYVVARHAGFTQTESFLYSAFMSTFFWEYGIEAFAEVPSIQDLILTPVLGSLLGEFFVQGAEKVKAQGGTVLGSKILGSTSLFLMDPAGGILDATDRLLKDSPFEDSEFGVYSKVDSERDETRLGFNIILWMKKK